MGFRDDPRLVGAVFVTYSFSIPCESWGSATQELEWRNTRVRFFQYSLRIVGFRDLNVGHVVHLVFQLSVFPANRGVPRHGDTRQDTPVATAFSIPCESWGSATPTPSGSGWNASDLSVFPANRGVPRR